MKTTADQSPAPLTSGNMQVHNVGISDNAEDQLMILNVLSNTLYTDKVSAVLREYGCNAADANTEAGRGDTPIEVRLPNLLDPTVAIRDFGFGMTEEQILNTFIKLGRSTKRNSNAFTGMLGIGSKAGFAYGDSFLVTSYCGGQKVVYNLYRDRGAPKLAKMMEAPSDAPDGIEVKVPVRTDDMAEFITKAQLVFNYFKVRPKVTGAKIEWEQRDPVFDGKSWRFVNNGRSVAIMGNVAYALDSVAMALREPDAYSSNKLTDEQRYSTLINLGVELDFRIGDLEIAANREGLQYSDLTKTALTKALAVVVAEIGKVYSDKIAGATSMWEAKKTYNDLFQGDHSYNRYTVRKLIGGKLMWKGQAISSSEFNLDPPVSIIPNVSYAGYRVGSRRWSARTAAVPGSYTASHIVTVAPDDEVALIENDLGKLSTLRMRGVFLDGKIQRAVVFTFADKTSRDTYLKATELEGAPLTLLSTVTPAPPVVGAKGTTTVSAHRTKHSASVLVWDDTAAPSYGQPKSAWWKSATVDLKKDTGIYVVLSTFEVRVPPATAGGSISFSSPEHFKRDLGRLKAMGFIDKNTPIYGVKVSSEERLKSAVGFVALEDHLKVKMDALVKNTAELQKLADGVAAIEYGDCMFVCKAGQLPAGSSARTLREAEEAAMSLAGGKVDAQCQHFRSDSLSYTHSTTHRWVGKAPKLPKPTHDLKALKAAVLKDYPLLAYLNPTTLRSSADQKNIIDYIRLVESV